MFNIICDLGIFWTSDDDECGNNFGLAIKCLFAGSFAGNIKSRKEKVKMKNINPIKTFENHS